MTGPPVEAGKIATIDIALRRAVPVIQEVRDEENDAPVPSVRLSMRSGWQITASGDTDVSGRLLVHALPGSATTVPVRVPAPYYDPSGGLIPSFEVADKSEGAVRILQLARGGQLNGVVLDDNQRPLAGAEVVGFWKAPRVIAVHTWSNARGEFTIPAVAPQTPVCLWTSHAESTTVEPVFAQPGGQPVVLVVGKEPGVSLEGRVVDGAGQPIDRAVVRVAARQNKFVNGRTVELGYVLFDGNDRLATDAQGRFQTPRYLRPNATYSVEVAAPGLSPGQSEPIEPESWRTTRFAEVVLHPAPRLRAVNGRLVDRDGRAVAGAAVWQAGDGPRRTQTTSDAEGCFQLEGIYDAPAFLFVRKDGYRLQGARIGATDKTREIILRRSDEPPAALATLPPTLPIKAERELAMSLVEPLLPILQDPIFQPYHSDLLRIVARADPARGLEIADTILTNPVFKSVARQAAALSLVSADLDEALVVIALMDQPYARVDTCVFACDQLVGAPLDVRSKLLEEALVHANAEADPGSKARELGRIAVHWLDLGRRERGVKLLREGQSLAEALPAPQEANLRLSAYRGVIAGMLARIDTPAALRLMEGFSGRQLINFRADVARGLADHNPAEAERLFGLIESPPAPFRMRLAPLARMAATDPERAARLARTFVDPYERAFALGTVAHSLVAKDSEAAAGLLEEAYELLEQAGEVGPTDYGRRDAALTAAALLPVAEKIEPLLVEEYLWRSLSLRRPWPVPGDLAWRHDMRLAGLSAMVARYDRGIARDLLAPLAERLREVPAEASASVTRALALIDPRWAAELVAALPDSSAPLNRNPKLIASRLLAECLALPQHGFWGSWQQLFLHCDLRDPDTLDEVW